MNDEIIIKATVNGYIIVDRENKNTHRVELVFHSGKDVCEYLWKRIEGRKSVEQCINEL